MSDTYKKNNQALFNRQQAGGEDPGPEAPELIEYSNEVIRVPMECFATMLRWRALIEDPAFPTYPTGEAPETTLISTLEANHFPSGFDEPAKHWRHLWAKSGGAIAGCKRYLAGEVTEETYNQAWSPIRMDGKEWDAPLYGPPNRRCMARTARGYLALVGEDAREGDSVVLLRGCRTPYVVRRQGGC